MILEFIRDPTADNIRVRSSCGIDRVVALLFLRLSTLRTLRSYTSARVCDNSHPHAA